MRTSSTQGRYTWFINNKGLSKKSKKKTDQLGTGTLVDIVISNNEENSKYKGFRPTASSPFLFILKEIH